MLHICCAPCATHVLETLRREFAITAFFYNPNIHPPQERLRRAEEARDLCRQIGIEIVLTDEDADEWSRRMRGRGSDKEGGAHCSVCFWIRLARTAAEAQGRGLEYFATTLTISPHKNAEIINRLGHKAARHKKVIFYPADFKKGDGFRKSCRLSREYGLYRQDYCGCADSLREREERRRGRSDATGAGSRRSE
jgi:predicted adenine nucleotide alpha hydrolase (AANH) superfamily ATPase